MKRPLSAVAAAVAAAAAYGADSAEVRLVPAPRAYEPRDGRCRVEVARATDAAHFYDYDLKGACLAAAPVTEAVDATLPPEGYSLSVEPGAIRIAAADAAGRFYARETLRQLAVEASTNAVAIPCCEIRDWPQYRWRGLMIDEARHFLGKTAVKRIIDQMAHHKLNVLHWHLTDDQGWRLDLSRHPELVRYGAVRPQSVKFGTHARWLPPNGELSFEYDGERYGPFFYSRADVEEILAHAKARHVTVVPEIEMPGHVRALLAAHPELSCRGDVARVPRVAWSIDDDVLCVGNDGTLRLLKDILDEVCDLFPDAPYIHIGGDECPRVRWEACAKCRRRIREERLGDANGLQGWIVSQVVRHIEAKGRRAVGWDEVLAGDVPRSTVGMTWRSSQAEGAQTGYVSAREALRRGHEMVLTPNAQCYLSRRQFSSGDPHSYYSPTGPLITLETAYSFDPADGIPEAVRARILGGQASVWGEAVPNLHDFEWKTWPRACAIAESLWLGAAKPGFDDFLHRMKTHRDRLVAAGVMCAPLD